MLFLRRCAEQVAPGGQLPATSGASSPSPSPPETGEEIWNEGDCSKGKNIRSYKHVCIDKALSAEVRQVFFLQNSGVNRVFFLRRDLRLLSSYAFLGGVIAPPSTKGVWRYRNLH